jgi:hypothetical protein
VAVILGVVRGHRPRRPEECAGSGKPISNDFWKIITRCWAQVPSERPLIVDVVQALEHGDENAVDALQGMVETLSLPERSGKSADLQICTLFHSPSDGATGDKEEKLHEDKSEETTLASPIGDNVARKKRRKKKTKTQGVVSFS